MPQIRTLIANRFIQIVFLFFGIFCISLLAIQPFTLNQMPETADGILHLFRVAATDYSLKVDNPLWIRYSTGIVYGYGAPLFNYFPPLSYYAGSWLHTFGLTFVQSWLMMMVIYTMLSALGMFLLGRIWTQSNVGGWVSAIAYIYAPYYLFDGVARGTSSELAALAILPFALYGFTRLAIYGRRIDFIFAVFAFALFIPMHTLITLHGTALMGLYCLFLWLTSDDKRNTFFRLLFAGGLAYLMTAFFWMPAILETDAVKIDLIAENLDQVDVTRHLRPLGEILVLPHTADPTQQNQQIPITLSWVQLILAGFGLVIAWNDRSPIYRNLLLFLGAIVAVLVFLNTPTSSWIWENVPLMGYTQFPWRVLGLASLALALMTGISIWLAWVIVPEGWRKLAVFSVLTLIVVVYSIPWTYSLYFDDIALNDIRDVHAFERKTGQLTVSSYSEYLPISTDESKLDPNRLIERFEQADIIPRLIATDDFEILSQEWSSTSGNLQIQSDKPQTLIFDWLWIEGWTVVIDGATLPTYPSQPEGLVTIDVPEGEFNLNISLQPTGTQSLSVVLSLVGLGLAFAVLALWKYIGGFSNLHGITPDPEIKIFGIVVAIGIGVFLFKAIILDYTSTGFMSRRFDDLASENVEIAPLANFGNQIDLVDIDVQRYAIFKRILPIKLYLKLHDSPIEADYSAIVQMRNPAGIVVAEQNVFQMGGIDTSNWMRDAYIEATIELEIPTFTSPLADDTNYTIDLSLFNATTLEPLSIINAQGNPENVLYTLDAFSLREQVFRGNFYYNQVREPWETDSDWMAIYSPQLPNIPDSAKAGDEIEFDWTWQKLKTGSAFEDHRAVVQWLDVDRRVVAESNPVPISIGYPTELWMRGTVIQAHHRVIVPPELPAGDYQIGIQLLSDTIRHEHYVLDHSMSISVPERILEEPTVEYKAQVYWENRIRLMGYDLDNNLMRFVWQTDSILDKNLRLFVHVLNDDDLIIAQSDGIPLDWTRPTTSWIPEEFIITTHTFDLPTGEYRIRVGWYDPVTGDRIAYRSDDSLILNHTLKID